MQTRNASTKGSACNDCNGCIAIAHFLFNFSLTHFSSSIRESGLIQMSSLWKGKWLCCLREAKVLTDWVERSLKFPFRFACAIRGSAPGSNISIIFRSYELSFGFILCFLTVWSEEDEELSSIWRDLRIWRILSQIFIVLFNFMIWWILISARPGDADARGSLIGILSTEHSVGRRIFAPGIVIV